MGQFRIAITAVGGHGCQREKKHGETVGECGQPTCPDCIARRAVAALKQVAGCNIEEAILTHWRGQLGEVNDNLLTGVRSGSF